MSNNRVTVNLGVIRGLEKKVLKAIRPALARVAKPTVKAIRTKAPVDTGALRASIGSKVTGKRGRYVAVIGVRLGEFKGKLPQLYGKKVDAQTQFISSCLPSVASLTADLQAELQARGIA